MSIDHSGLPVRHVHGSHRGSVEHRGGLAAWAKSGRALPDNSKFSKYGCFPILAHTQAILPAGVRTIYFGFEVDEKLLPFAIEEFGDQCWVYGSDIPHGDRLYGAVDVFLKRNDISEASKRKLFVDNTARFYGLEKLET